MAPIARNASIRGHSNHGLSAGTGVVPEGGPACTLPVAVAEHGAGVPDGAHVACTEDATEAVLTILAGGVAATVAVTV
jgi:hypothetical protein